MRKPPKKFDRSAYYKQWDRAIGPLVRLVEKIGHGVDEPNSEYKRHIHDRLEAATQEMAEWMEVDPFGNPKPRVPKPF